MRLYLSSFRIGAFRERLLALTAGRQAALVPNALDGLPPDERHAGLQRDIADPSRLGLEVCQIDLRDPDAAEWFPSFDIIWVRGGKVFVLRRVLARNGTGQVLCDL